MLAKSASQGHLDKNLGKSRICDAFNVYAKAEKVTPPVRMKVTSGKKFAYLTGRQNFPITWLSAVPHSP
jgi:hypothetical protein